MEITVKARIDRVTFSTPNERFFIFYATLLDTHKKGTRLSFKGYAHSVEPHPDLVFTATGNFTSHPKYGEQFDFIKMSEVLESEYGIVMFLQHNFKSIGPAAAKNIASKFGADTVKILNDNIDVLDDCEFLTTEQRRQIKENWFNLARYRDVALFLHDLGVTPGLVSKVWAKLGSDTQIILTENPYRLMDVPGIGFTKADMIATKTGFPPDSNCRIQACLNHCIDEVCFAGGNTYTYVDPLLSRMLDYLGDHVTRVKILENIKLLRDAKKLITDKDSDGAVTVASPKLHWAEQRSAEFLVKHISTNENVDLDYLPNFIARQEGKIGYGLSEDQKKSIELVYTFGCAVITGLPGTGKTTVTRVVYELLKDMGKRICLMAPTGVAAKRMESAIPGAAAFTIHRTLGYMGDDEFSFNEDNKLDCSAAIIDESSMVDVVLLEKLLAALPDSAVIVFVGDHAQLPSVGPGNVLFDLINSNIIPVVRFTKIYRQGELSGIITAAHDIYYGKVPDFGKKGSDFRVVEIVDSSNCPDHDKIRESTKEVAIRLFNGDFGSFQVLAPMYKGQTGIHELNTLLRDALNPLSPGDLQTKKFRVNDRIMVTANDYDLGVFNGDMGKVDTINKASNTVTIKVFGDPDKYVTMETNEAHDMLTLAYCVSIHKCVHPSTYTEVNGGLYPIGILNSSGSISSHSGTKPYTQVHKYGEAPALQLETEDGYTLTATPNHGLDVWDGTSFTKQLFQDIRPGALTRLKLGCVTDRTSYVTLPPSVSVHSSAMLHNIPVQVTHDVAEFLGLMVADGTVYDAGFRLAKEHVEVADRFDALCRSIFGVEPKRFFTLGAHHVEVNSTYLVAWLRQIGGIHPNNKYVPDCVMESGTAVQRKFCKAFFEDGSVHLRRGRNILDHIQIAIHNPHLRYQVYTLLLRLGIAVSCIKSKTTPILAIYGQQALVFGKEIGFITYEKDRRSKLPAGAEWHTPIPVSAAEIQECRKHAIVRLPKNLRNKEWLKRGTWSKYFLNGVLSKLDPQSDIHSILVDKLGYNYQFVKSMIPTECESVCVEVPDGHQFLQNGFCGWNSQGNAWDTVIIILTRDNGRMLYRNLIYTAITRARSRVLILGDRQAVTRAIENNDANKRNTKLAKVLRSVYDSTKNTDTKETVDVGSET